MSVHTKSRVWMGVIAIAASASLVLAACSSPTAKTSSSASSDSSPVTVTLWHEFGTTQEATAISKLADAYHGLHPNVTIKLVSQPAENYYALLQASSISHTGPDLAVTWPGLYTLKYANILQPLNDLIPKDTLAAMPDLKFSSLGFDEKSQLLSLPWETVYYMGYYNKDAFSKAGVTTPLNNWQDLFQACDKLRKSGITPIVYGNGGQGLGAEFFPWFDMSFIEAGLLSPDQWKGLYDGDEPWNAPDQVQALEKWSSLHDKGCTNPDVLTKTNNLDDFTSGKAAMIIDGTWDTKAFTDKMGSNVGAIVPPLWDSGKLRVPVLTNAFSIMKGSQHTQAAAQFLTYLASAEALPIIDAAGVIGARHGATSSNPVNQQIIDLIEKNGAIRYPLLDNVIQGPVVDVGVKVLPSVLAGKISAADATKQLADEWQRLPADQRGSTYK